MEMLEVVYRDLEAALEKAMGGLHLEWPEARTSLRTSFLWAVTGIANNTVILGLAKQPEGLATVEPKEPKPYSVWRHYKGGLYVVLCVATCSTNGHRDGVEKSVVYHSLKYGHVRYRELSEFMDGRFIELSAEDSRNEPE